MHCQAFVVSAAADFNDAVLNDGYTWLPYLLHKHCVQTTECTTVCVWCKCSDPIDSRYRLNRRRDSGRGQWRGGRRARALSPSYLKPLVTGRGSDAFGGEDDWWKIIVCVVVPLICRQDVILSRETSMWRFALHWHFVVFAEYMLSVYWHSQCMVFSASLVGQQKWQLASTTSQVLLLEDPVMRPN